MLLTGKDKPFDSADYFFEYKWDGFRCLLFFDGEEIFLQSRNLNNLTPHFPELVKLKGGFKGPMVLDGEICYYSKEGKPGFSVLQKRMLSTGPQMAEKFPVFFITWDILATGEDTHHLPLRERKDILKNHLPDDNPFIYLSPYLQKKGKYLYQQAREQDLEGIVAKKINSPYQFKRSPYWYKIKIWKYKEVFIGGYTRDRTALLVGEKDDHGKLKYQGKIQCSLPGVSEQALFNYLSQLRTDKSPFREMPVIDSCWVKALIKVKVRYTGLTSHNFFRHGYAVDLV